MTGFSLRLAEPGDAQGIADCFNGLDIEDLGDDALAPHSVETVLRDAVGDGALLQTEVAISDADGAVIGVAAHNLGYHAETARHARWLEMLYVKPEWRSHGVGAALMRRLAQQALAMGCDSVAWGVRRHNNRGIAFYDRLGADTEHADIRVLLQAGLDHLAADD